MGNKNDKQRRKQILTDLKLESKRSFEESLPMDRANFGKLFDYLDEVLEEKGCDNTNKLSKQFLTDLGIEDPDLVLKWLASHGGYCDCEILLNVVSLF
jgi:hypothetical protein